MEWTGATALGRRPLSFSLDITVIHEAAHIATHLYVSSILRKCFPQKPVIITVFPQMASFSQASEL